MHRRPRARTGPEAWSQEAMPARARVGGAGKAWRGVVLRLALSAAGVARTCSKPTVLRRLSQLMVLYV